MILKNYLVVVIVLLNNLVKLVLVVGFENLYKKTKFLCLVKIE